MWTVSLLCQRRNTLLTAFSQGVLPWTGFWVSTKPFGTPFGPYLLKWALTLLMILAPPAGDAYNFGQSPNELLEERC